MFGFVIGSERPLLCGRKSRRHFGQRSFESAQKKRH
jgi:hypothetical protein